MITEGKGEDEEELGDEEEESEKEDDLVQKKGKMIITKPPKPSTTIFIGRSKKKGGKDVSEVEFYRSPPTYEERLKQLWVGVGVKNFISLKYEISTPTE